MRTAVVFDFGRVLVDFDFRMAFRHWARTGQVSEEHIVEAFSHDAAYCAHERGEIAWPEYSDHLRQLLGLRISDVDLLLGWNAIFLGPIVGMREKLAALAVTHPVYVFSNTNAAHFAHWSSTYERLLQPVKLVLCSHLLGARKPEPVAFLRMLERIGRRAEETVFFDDIAENVYSARQIGIDARLFISPDDVEPSLL